MNTQKICVIGDGLTGLTTALAMANCDLQVDLYVKGNEKIKKDIRTTAISELNFLFMKQVLGGKNLQYMWPCKKINLYYENNKKQLNFLNFNEKSSRLMYIFQNYKLRKSLINKILLNKNIKLIKNSINKIDHNDNSVLLKRKKIFYDIIILSTGSRSKLFNTINVKRSIFKDYKQTAVTSILNHDYKINGASQYFLKEGPLAILPFGKKMFSIVWSLDNKFYEEKKSSIKTLIITKIKKLMPEFKKLQIQEIHSFPLKLELKTKYFKKNVLILGDALHSVHPVAGQGFNLILKDIKKLSHLILKNKRLGLQIKDSSILKNFTDERKPENIIIGLGIDLTNTFFRNNSFFPFKEKIIKNINNFGFLKKISKFVSNGGIIN